MEGLAALANGMGRLEAAMTVMAPAMTTKYEMDKFKTAMQTRFDDMSKRLAAMEAAMQNFDARMAMQRLQDGWGVVSDEDDTGSTGAGLVWDYDWQSCRRRRTQ